MYSFCKGTFFGLVIAAATFLLMSPRSRRKLGRSQAARVMRKARCVVEDMLP